MFRLDLNVFFAQTVQVESLGVLTNYHYADLMRDQHVQALTGISLGTGDPLLNLHVLSGEFLHRDWAAAEPFPFRCIP